jgi:CheY-like chemotaxis protein
MIDTGCWLGVECDAASGGGSVCGMVERGGGRDVYFVDWKMPGTDGIGDSRRINEHDPGKPMIIMTANVFREDIERCLAEGMNDHLGKPLKVDDVMAKLRIYLRGQK